MTIQELFIASNNALLKSIQQIRDDQWDLPMPEGSSSKPSVLSDAVRDHIYDDAWVPDVLAGKAKDEVGDTYDALLQTETDTIKAKFKELNERASQAVDGFTDLDKIVHLSYGDYPAKEYLQHVITFRAFRSYDIAKLIGADTAMDPEFVQALWDEYTPIVEGYRQMGVFPPALIVDNDSELQKKLLAMVGRK